MIKGEITMSKNIMGYWIHSNDDWFDFYRCSECGHKEPYTPNDSVKRHCECGCRMVNATDKGIVDLNR